MNKIKSTLLACVIMATLCVHAQSSPEIFTGKEGALNGYDPVAFFKDSKPVKGTSTFSMVWKDATWYFASAANLESFKAEPEKYAPQYGGYCAFGMSRGYKAPTQPDTWSIVGGKLYFNYNLDVKKEWNKAQDEYISKANANWPEAKSK